MTRIIDISFSTSDCQTLLCKLLFYVKIADQMTYSLWHQVVY